MNTVIGGVTQESIIKRSTLMAAPTGNSEITAGMDELSALLDRIDGQIDELRAALAPVLSCIESPLKTANQSFPSVSPMGGVVRVQIERANVIMDHITELRSRIAL